jgi:Tfp pilus assembly protein PilF
LGICTITPGNIIIFGFLAIFWILWQKRTGFIKYFLIFCLGLGLVLGVLVLRSYIVDKKPALLTGNTGLNFYIGNSAEANGTLVWPMNLTPAAGAMLRDAAAIAKLNLGRELGPSGVSGFWFKKAIDFIKKNPPTYFRLLLRKAGYLFSPKELIFEPEYTFVSDKIRVFKVISMDLGLILPFAFLGMLLNLKNITKTWSLYLVLLTLGASIILFFVQAKFRIMLVPFLMIFAASAVSEFWKLARNKSFLRFGFLLLVLTVFFILLRQPRGSTNQIEKAQANFSEFRYHFAKAVAYEGKSDYRSALSELNLADKIKPDNHNIAYSFGVMYYNMNKFDKSEEYFKRAIAISPFFVDAYYNLGFLYNRQKRFDEALAVLKKAAFLDPDDIGVLFQLARTYRAKGMFKEARQDLDLVLKKVKYRPLEKAAIEKELADLEK